MTILILGGTGFIGPHLVDAAMERGHQMTLFTRGKRAATVDARGENVIGDRRENLGLLAGRTWDAVIDTSGYFPGDVTLSSRAMKDSAAMYLFVSTISVYRDMATPGTEETAPVARLADPEAAEQRREITGETYGPLKALCEEAAEAEMPGRTLVIRPGLIVGPGDPTDRFTYWPARVARGGDVLAPMPADAAVQFIDARDLAQWMIRAIEQNLRGVYNATGPKTRFTMGELLDNACDVARNDARLIWIDETFLLSKGVQPFIELPLWIPGDEYRGFHGVSIEKAVSAGLHHRPVRKTVADTMAFAANRPGDYVWRAGLTSERESELRREWRATGR